MEILEKMLKVPHKLKISGGELDISSIGVSEMLTLDKSLEVTDESKFIQAIKDKKIRNVEILVENLEQNTFYDCFMTIKPHNNKINVALAPYDEKQLVEQCSSCEYSGNCVVQTAYIHIISKGEKPIFIPMAPI